MGAALPHPENGNKSRKDEVRYRICSVCGQIFDELDAKQVRHHAIRLHAPLLDEKREW